MSPTRRFVAVAPAVIGLAGLGDRSVAERAFGIAPDWVFEFTGIRTQMSPFYSS